MRKTQQQVAGYGKRRILSIHNADTKEWLGYHVFDEHGKKITKTLDYKEANRILMDR